MVQEVQSLNKKIENINVQRTKAEAKVDMLKKQLLSEISAYKAAYGVDLSDKNFAKLSGKVKAELSMVSETIKSEYELKEKVVTAIEGGDYDEAYRLLGIKPEGSEEVESTEEEIFSGADAEESMNIEMDFGVDESTSVEEEQLTPVKKQDNVVISSSSDTSKSKGKATIDDLGDFGDLVVEDDDDDESSGGVMLDNEVGMKSSSKGSNNVGVKGEGVLDAVDSMGVEDDDDGIPSMDDETWGFGDILSGTQFQNN